MVVTTTIKVSMCRCSRLVIVRMFGLCVCFVVVKWFSFLLFCRGCSASSVVVSDCATPSPSLGPVRVWFFFFWRNSSSVARASVFTKFVDHTHYAPPSVGFLWTSDQLVVETSTWQHSQQTAIHAPAGIRTHNPSKRAAADLRLIPRGHWERQFEIILIIYRTRTATNY
jgi:hypothetical protein